MSHLQQKAAADAAQNNERFLRTKCQTTCYGSSQEFFCCSLFYRYNK